MPICSQPWGHSYFETEYRSGQVPLLLLNGLGYTRWSWGWQKWPSEIAPIVLENRGLGGSECDEHDFEIADLADDAARLLDHLQLPRAVVWGVSMGGMIAQEFAIRHPARCAGLILGCTRHGGQDVPLSPETEELMRDLASQGWSRQSLLHGLGLNFARPLPDQEGYLDIRLEHRPDVKIWHRQIAAIGRFDASARLSQWKGASLILTGDLDPVVPPANSLLLRALLPQAQFKEYSPAAHVFWIEHPDQVGQDVSQFALQCWT